MFLVISLLFVFSVGGNTDKAHAAVTDHACAHHQIDHDDNLDNEPCHSAQDQNHDENECDDCCCVHTHSMATSPVPLKTALNVNKQNIIVSEDHHRSIDLSGLKRPPRL